MRHRASKHIARAAGQRRRRTRFLRCLRTVTEAGPSRRRWLDICQISDAMFAPFVEAVGSRLPRRALEVESLTHVAPNATLCTYCIGLTPLDTGLRVFGRPVLRLRETGAYVCEAMPGEGFLLIYQPSNRNEATK